MRNEWKPAIRAAIKWEKVTEYAEHGCRITGRLLVARYLKAWEMHPRYGEYNSGSSLDVLELAREILKDQGIEHVEKLAIPDLVVHVSVADWGRFPGGTKKTRGVCKIGH